MKLLQKSTIILLILSYVACEKKRVSPRDLHLYTQQIPYACPMRRYEETNSRIFLEDIQRNPHRIRGIGKCSNDLYIFFDRHLIYIGTNEIAFSLEHNRLILTELDPTNLFSIEHCENELLDEKFNELEKHTVTTFKYKQECYALYNPLGKRNKINDVKYIRFNIKEKFFYWVYGSPGSGFPEELTNKIIPFSSCDSSILFEPPGIYWGKPGIDSVLCEKYYTKKDCTIGQFRKIPLPSSEVFYYEVPELEPDKNNRRLSVHRKAKKNSNYQYGFCIDGSIMLVTSTNEIEIFENVDVYPQIQFYYQTIQRKQETDPTEPTKMSMKDFFRVVIRKKNDLPNKFGEKVKIHEIHIRKGYTNVYEVNEAIKNRYFTEKVIYFEVDSNYTLSKDRFLTTEPLRKIDRTLLWIFIGLVIFSIVAMLAFMLMQKRKSMLANSLSKNTFKTRSYSTKKTLEELPSAETNRQTKHAGEFVLNNTETFDSTNKTGRRRSKTSKKARRSRKRKDIVGFKEV